jgi:hypothetical protein
MNNLQAGKTKSRALFLVDAAAGVTAAPKLVARAGLFMKGGTNHHVLRGGRRVRSSFSCHEESIFLFGTVDSDLPGNLLGQSTRF